jgi:CTP synthase
MKIGGIYPRNNLVETVEIPGHRWFIATQYHPEFKSKPVNPHPLFKSFIKASIDK